MPWVRSSAVSPSTALWTSGRLILSTQTDPRRLTSTFPTRRLLSPRVPSRRHDARHRRGGHGPVRWPGPPERAREDPVANIDVTHEPGRALLGLPDDAEGVLPSQALERAAELGMIDAGEFKIAASSIQPASVD